MSQQPSSNSPSLLQKYKQRIALYEDSSEPLAPLSSSQKQFLLDLSHTPVERPVPPHLTPIPHSSTLTLNGSLPQGYGDVDFSKFNFKTKHEVLIYICLYLVVSFISYLLFL